jgi:hypothetical protein
MQENSAINEQPNRNRREKESPLERLRTLALSVAILLGCLSTILPGGCEQPRASGGNSWGASKNASDLKIHTLKEAPELPQLPAYSGKSKFLRGWLHSTEGGLTNYQLNYLTKEPPSAVKDWYQGTFNSCQWKTIHAGRQSLNANNKDGYTCTIMVNDSKVPGYLAQLRIYYSLPPTQRR